MVPLSAEASKTASPRRAPLVRDTSARASPRHLGDVRGAPDVPEGPRAPDASEARPRTPFRTRWRRGRETPRVAMPGLPR